MVVYRLPLCESGRNLLQNWPSLPLSLSPSVSIYFETVPRILLSLSRPLTPPSYERVGPPLSILANYSLAPGDSLSPSLSPSSAGPTIQFASNPLSKVCVCPRGEFPSIWECPHCRSSSRAKTECTQIRFRDFFGTKYVCPILSRDSLSYRVRRGKSQTGN